MLSVLFIFIYICKLFPSFCPFPSLKPNNKDTQSNIYDSTHFSKPTAKKSRPPFHFVGFILKKPVHFSLRISITGLITVTGSRAMTNTCVSKFGGIQKSAFPILTPRKYGIVFVRKFSTCASPFAHSSVPLGYPVSSLVLNGRVTASDAPQRSDEWFALRKDKLTTSTFSTVLGFWKGNRRYELWYEKVFAEEVKFQESAKSAMAWGVRNEETAIERYKSITGRDVSSFGFAVHSEDRLDWLGASPDGLLGSFPGGGILEVKCPFNKGKPETGLPWSTMPFYYMPQVQGQMEIMNRDWADLYCWTPNGSTIFRVWRERSYWELIHGILQEFWWENVVPAREALLSGREEETKLLKPTSTHRQTGLAVVKSMKLASEVKLLCREIAGHVEFYR